MPRSLLKAGMKHLKDETSRNRVTATKQSRSTMLAESVMYMHVKRAHTHNVVQDAYISTDTHTS